MISRFSTTAHSKCETVTLPLSLSAQPAPLPRSIFFQELSALPCFHAILLSHLLESCALHAPSHPFFTLYFACAITFILFRFSHNSLLTSTTTLDPAHLTRMRYIIISLAIALISFALFGQVVFGASTTATTVATSTFTTIPASMVPKDDPTKVDMLVNDHNSKMIMRVFGHTFGYTSFVCSAFPTSTPVSTTTAASAPKCTSTDDRKNVTIQLPAKVADYLVSHAGCEKRRLRHSPRYAQVLIFSHQ